jgi:predicted nucleic acid-binding Zn ribbon protein
MKYDYTCECGKKTSKHYPIGKSKDPMCLCGKTMQRYIIPPKVVFNGDGFSLNKMR